jgi:UPF0755 protein
MKPVHLKLLLCSLGIGILCLLMITYYLHAFLHNPMKHTGEPIIIEVKPNTSASALSNLLYQKKLIPSRQIFLSLIKWQGKSGQLKAGVYQILPGQSVQELLDKLVHGDVLKESFRIIEGSNLTQVIANLKQAPYLNYNDSDWSGISSNYPSAEGLLLADTYNYNAGSDAKTLLKQANSNLMQFLEKNWQERTPGLPYKTSYELLIVASILEKESAIPNERELISGVVVNRLIHHMPLQMDPTVIYALGSGYTGKLHHNDLTIDSPYNTYRYRGLPPTPISMVGKSSIYAAAHPQKTNYLYFVAKGDGSHSFSETYTDQRKAVNFYQKSGNNQ